jgi:hypothetical protein
MDREEILVKEYEACQEDNKAQSSHYWTIFGIFFSVNTAIFGGIAYGLFSTTFIRDILSANSTDLPQIFLTLFILSIIVFGLILFTYILKRWLDRVNFLIQTNNARVHEIEIILGTWRSLRIHIIDKWERVRNQRKFKQKPCNEQEKIIWHQVWKELSAELPKNLFALLCKQKSIVKNLLLPQSNKPEKPNKFNATIIFWALSSIWIILLAFLWSLLAFPYIHTWVYAIYTLVVIVMFVLYKLLK